MAWVVGVPGNWIFRGGDPSVATCQEADDSCPVAAKALKQNKKRSNLITDSILSKAKWSPISAV